MAVQVAFDDGAIADLENIHRFIAHRSRASAARVMEQLLEDVDRLAQFPRIGRKVSNTAREWVVSRLPYVIAYEFDDLASFITVTAVFHVAQDR